MDQDFEQELLEIFKAEAEDYLTVLNEGLATLKDAPTDQVLEVMFRTTHSLKGAARAVNFSGVEELCQAMETLFSRLKNHELEISNAILNVLTLAIDTLNDLITQGDFQLDADPELIVQLQVAAKGELPADDSKEKGRSIQKAQIAKTEKKKAEDKVATHQPTASEAETPTKKKNERSEKKQETIRIPYARIRKLFNQSEELISIKIKYKYYLEKIAQLNDRLEHLNQKGAKQSASFSPNSTAANANLFLIHSQMEELKKEIDNLHKNLVNDRFQISSMIDKHLDDIKQLMMFPFATITNYIERSTRTIARELNKKINLKILGSEIEMDKHVLELLKDPLIHLIRNSLDHGIEPPRERLARGKSEIGNILIEVLPPRDQKIIIKISDDGRGLDLKKIKRSALEKNLFTEKELEEMNDSQLLSLIFHSGFSTKDQVSKLSGRGLGMAVVAENIEKLGGSLKVENYFPNGCAFLLTIPLSFATSRGILIVTGQLRALIPTQFVRLPLRIPVQQLKTVKNQFILNHEGQNIPLFALSSLLSIDSDEHEMPRHLNVLVLHLQNEEIAITVDDIVDEREILLKNLNPPLEEVPFLSGMTILGDGSLVPVLNVHDIFKAALHLKSTVGKKRKSKKKEILVVEDSITSRVLLKNLLEAAGFNVRTAINGKQAWEILQNQTFDLIISDVQMPEMDGIQLTRKVKQDPQLKPIPVILLTSLNSENDKKLGLDAGANAYYVKSDFKQKSVLDLIHRLI